MSIFSDLPCFFPCTREVCTVTPPDFFVVLFVAFSAALLRSFRRTWPFSPRPRPGPRACRRAAVRALQNLENELLRRSAAVQSIERDLAGHRFDHRCRPRVPQRLSVAVE